MIVKIIDNSRPHTWYGDKLGEIYIVEEVENREFGWLYKVISDIDGGEMYKGWLIDWKDIKDITREYKLKRILK